MSAISLGILTDQNVPTQEFWDDIADASRSLPYTKDFRLRPRDGARDLEDSITIGLIFFLSRHGILESGRLENGRFKLTTTPDRRVRDAALLEELANAVIMAAKENPDAWVKSVKQAALKDLMSF